MESPLTSEQLRTLTSICDTLVPALDPPGGVTPVEAGFWRLSASDLNVPAEFANVLAAQPPDRRQKLVLLLNMLAKPTLAGFLTGSFEAFHELDRETREQILLRWSTSAVPELRQGFQAFKRLTHALFYALTGEGGTSPAWPAIGYPGPAANLNPPASPIQPLEITGPTSLDCDVVIVGSGAGGGVVAAELAQAGHKVIVLEKADYVPPAAYTAREQDAFGRMYEQSGLMTTEDLGIIVLAGSTLGGGTTINWSASFRTPDHVLEEWESEYGVEGLTGAAFQQSLDDVCARLGVNTDDSRHSKQTAALIRGCDALSYPHRLIPRNTSGCARDECGWCTFGCPTGGKNGTLKTYLADAQRAGAEIIAGCFARRVIVENGRAVGVDGWARDRHGAEHALTVRARIVVAAAGTLHTPALLLRSGLRNPNIGRHLRLHPVTVARGEYPEPIELWRGPPLTGYTDQFANLNGRHYGAILEVPAAHTGLLASALPWRSGRQHKAKMLRAAHQAAFITIVRDLGSGRVVIDKAGLPRLHYRLHPQDADHMITALIGGLRIHAAAGASEVGVIHTDLGDYNVAEGTPARFADYLDAVSRASRAPNRLGVFSAHQMGSCRMGGNPDWSAVNPQGESWEAENLFVADSSLFPTPSGVNPMITIMALAHRISQTLKTRL